MSIEQFWQDESGAFAVDWVVLAAGLVGLGLAVVVTLSSGVENMSTDTAHELANLEPTNAQMFD